jgi:hypothetical protein
MELATNHDGHQSLASHSAWHLRYWLFALVFVSGLSIAEQLKILSITGKDGEFKTHIVAFFDAPAEYVYAVVTDYKHIYRINPAIVATELLPAEDDSIIRVRNRIQHCVSFFCTEVEMVEDVKEVGDGLLVANAVPEISSFESGTAMWHIRPFGKGRTRVQYRATIKPDFFIPPVIGSLVVRSGIRKELAASFTRIECLAKIMARNNGEDEAAFIARRSGNKQACKG